MDEYGTMGFTLLVWGIIATISFMYGFLGFFGVEMRFLAKYIDYLWDAQVVLMLLTGLALRRVYMKIRRPIMNKCSLFCIVESVLLLIFALGLVTQPDIELALVYLYYLGVIWVGTVIYLFGEVYLEQKKLVISAVLIITLGLYYIGLAMAGALLLFRKGKPKEKASEG